MRLAARFYNTNHKTNRYNRDYLYHTNINNHLFKLLAYLPTEQLSILAIIFEENFVFTRTASVICGTTFELFYSLVEYAGIQACPLNREALWDANQCLAFHIYVAVTCRYG